MMNTSINKYESVRDKLAQAIRSKQMRSGQRLPSERKLAEQYHVSYLTVRRAVGDLVEAELLERRARQGTFVVDNLIEKVPGQMINIICSSYESLQARTFVGACMRQIEKRHKKANTIELAHATEQSVAKIILAGDPTIIFSTGPELKGKIGAAIQQAGSRVVLVGNRLDGLGVPSVMMDDGHGVRMAINHLRENGHTRIGMITADPNHLVSRIFRSVWQSECSADCTPKIIDKRLLAISFSRFECPATQAYESMKRYLTEVKSDATAYLCQVDEMAPGIMMALNEAGLQVPRDISLVAFGNTSASRFATPPLTSIDSDLESHVRFAFEIIDATMNESLTPADLFKLVQPVLIKRQSVATI